MSLKSSCTIGRALAFTAFFALLSSACSSPSAPTPTPAPPTPIPPPVAVADPPTITCPAGVPAATTSASGTSVTYALPTADKGTEPVTVACTPASGTTFPIGDTLVSCTATDALSRTASCSFAVRLTKNPSLSKTRFLAFGDSMTAGEVTFPSGVTALGVPSFSLVQVISAAYPTVLAKQLQAAYPAQQDNIAVANYGLGGEPAARARDRFIAALGVVRPDAVLLMEGANDIHLGEDGAASTAASEIRAMASEARRRGMRVFIATIPPSRPGGNRTTLPVLVADYNARMRDVARSEGAVLVDVFSALATSVTTYIGVDGLHPNEAGYAKMAETFFNAIRADLEVR